MTLTAAARTVTAPPPSRTGRTVLAALLVATFVVVLSSTITTVAIPPLSHDLGVTAGTAQWITTGYMLTMAAVIPITPFLTRRFRLRPLFLSAMALFTAATVLTATAPTLVLLLLGRIGQATGGAVTTPLMLTAVTVLVPAARRGRTMGLITLVMAAAPALGPTLAGIATDALGWRALFWLTLPLAAGVLIAGILAVRDVTTTGPAHLDVLSALLAAAGFGGIVLGLAGGCGPAATIAALVTGTIALAVFARRQRRLGDHALIDPRTFGPATFRRATLLLALTMLSLFGALVLIPIYLQEARGLSTAATGLALLPGGILTGLLAPLVGRLADQRGPALALPIGTIAVSAAFWALIATGQRTPLAWTIAAHLMLSTGIAFLMTPLFTVSLNVTPAPLAPHAGAVLNTIQQVAGAAGGGLLVTTSTTFSGLAGPFGQETAQKHPQAGFLTAAVISLAGIVLAARVARSPKEHQ